MSDPGPIPKLGRLARRGPGPLLHLLAADPSEAYDLARSFDGETGSGRVARVVRGTKARTIRALFDECAAAWQFPPYFGENWDALDECLADLGWVPARSYLLVVTDADRLLADERPEALGTFASLFDDNSPRGTLDADAPTFHVVFQVDPEAQATLIGRLDAAGVVSDML